MLEKNPVGGGALLDRTARLAAAAVIAAAVAFGCAAVFGLVPCAASAPDPLTPAERQWLKEHDGTIRLAPVPNYPPVDFRDERGDFIGLSQDYISRIEELLGLRFQRVEIDTFPALIDALKERRVDLTTSITPLPERERFLTFQTPHLHVRKVIIARADEPGAASLEELSGKLVAMVEGYLYSMIIREKYPQIRVTPIRNEADGLLAVSLGLADAAVVDLGSASYNIHRMKITNLRVAGDTPFGFDLAIASRSDWPELASILSKGLALIPPEERRAMEDRWFHLTPLKFYKTTEFWRGVSAFTVALLLMVLGTWTWRGELRSQVLARTAELQAELARRREAEEALRESRERLDLALNASGDGLWDWRLDTGEYYFSPRCHAMLGYGPGEIGEHIGAWRALVHPEDHGALEQAMTGRTRSGDAFAAEVRLRAKDGEWRWIMIRGRAVRHAPDGRPLRLSGTVTDVTERRRMREIMVQTEKMMSVGGLAAGMAHEINNPLSAVLQCAQVVLERLESESLNAEQAAARHGCAVAGIKAFLEERQVFAMLRGAREAAHRASKIVAGMLEFSRRSESRRTPSDLNALIEKALELCAADYDMKKKYDFRKVAIHRDYAMDLDPVPCNATQIEQVLMNLLRNAAQAMPCRGEGAPAPAITVRTRRDGDMARVEVEDNGPGMDETARKRAFEPFYTTKAPGEGTGLGLSVSYFIVTENHKGTIHVESPAAGGTRFVLKLPMLAKRGE
jgi:PAS domain S-box-containing protein